MISTRFSIASARSILATIAAFDPASRANRRVHVGGRTAERNRHEIHADRRRVHDVGAIPVGQRAQRQSAAEPVEPLAIRQHAIVEHRGADPIPIDRIDPQRQHAVVEQQHVARAHVIDQAEVAHADLRRIARRRIRAADQRERVALVQGHLAFGEGFDANLGALEIGEQPDLAADLRADGPHRLGALRVLFRPTVRKIHPHHVDAGAQHRFQHAGRVGCRAQRGEDLGTAQLVGHACSINDGSSSRAN
jgi:hypothetical protein